MAVEQVLDTLAWAERALLAEHPEYAAARVFVHLNSTIQVIPMVYRRCSLATRTVL